MAELPRPLPKRCHIATHAAIAGGTILQLVDAAWLPLHPSEADFALYGLRPDLSYADHPPLVGWLQWLTIQFSSSNFALRVIPILLTVAALYVLAALVRRLYPGETPWLGFIVVMLVQGMPVRYLSLGMAPEVPLMLLGVLAILLTHRVLSDDRWVDWAALGLTLGLAGLAKYTAASLALSLVLGLVAYGHGRRLWQPKIWVCAGLALLVVSPVIVWNTEHPLLSLSFHVGYQLEADSRPIEFSLRRALSAQGQQLIAYAPVVYVGGLIVLFATWRRYDPNTLLLLLFAAPVLALFVLLSGLGRSHAHWPMIAWVCLTPIVARWLVRTWSRKPVRALTYVSAAFSGVTILGAHLLMLPVWKLPDFKHPIKKIAGWEEASARAEATRRSMRVEGRDEPVLMVLNWHHAGPLAWYQWPVPVLDLTGRLSQYTVWYDAPAATARGVLVVPGRGENIEQRLEESHRCDRDDPVRAYYGPTLAQIYQIFRCEPVAPS